MIQEIKKKSLMKSLIGAAVLFAIAIAIVFIVFGDQVKLLTPAKNLDELTVEDLKVGMHVKGEIPYIIDYFAYLEDNGSTIETSYFIPMGEEGTICLIARGTTMKNAERTMEATWNYIDNEDVAFESIPSFQINGVLKGLTSEDYQYFKEYTSELDAEDAAYIFPYGVYCGIGAGSLSNDYFWAIVVIVVIVIIGAFALYYGIAGKSVAEIEKYCKKQTDPAYALDRIEQFYNMGTPVAGFRAGDEFFLAIRGTTTYFAESNQILWAYQKTTQHRTNGIPTGKTYSVLMKLANGGQLDIPMKKEAECQEALEYICKTMPYVIVGYDDDLVAMYAKNKDEMIRIVGERRAQANVF